MKESGILYKPEMVRAILSGAKTQTRRLAPVSRLDVRIQDSGMVTWGIQFSPAQRGTLSSHSGFKGTIAHVHNVIASQWCRYGTAGDVLVGRESFRASLAYELSKPSTIPVGSAILYEADGAGDLPGHNAGRLRPSMFMPRWVSRLVSPIVSVRLERLQDISEADALAEGIVVQKGGGFGLADTTHYHFSDPRISYWSLWEAINGAGSVDKNPWLWAIEFETPKAAA
jgi:hypothetical protein